MNINNSLRKFLYGLIIFAIIVIGVMFAFKPDLFIFVLFIVLITIFFVYRKNIDKLDEKYAIKKQIRELTDECEGDDIELETYENALISFNEDKINLALGLSKEKLIKECEIKIEELKIRNKANREKLIKLINDSNNKQQ